MICAYIHRARCRMGPVAFVYQQRQIRLRRLYPSFTQYPGEGVPCERLSCVWNVNGLVLQNQQFELAGVSMHERSQLFGDVSPASLAPHQAWSVSGASGAQLCHFNLMAIEVRRRSGCRGAAPAAAALRRCPCLRCPSSSAHPYMN